MFDSISFTVKGSLTPEVLENWTRYTKYNPLKDKSKVYYTYFECVNSGSVRYTYREEDFTFQPLLLIEVSSIGKILFGNNFTPFPDIQKQILLLLEETNNFHGLVRPSDLQKCKITRVDFCASMPTGEFLKYYLAYCVDRNYPKRVRRNYNNRGDRNPLKAICNGVVYSTRSKCPCTLKIYDKHEESGDERAEGILRVEACIRGDKNLASLFGKKRPTLVDLTDDIAIKTLNRDLTIIGLNNGFTVNGCTTLPDGKFSSRDLFLMNDFFKDRDLPVKDLIAKYNAKPRTIKNWIKRSKDLLPLQAKYRAKNGNVIKVPGLQVKPPD